MKHIILAVSALFLATNAFAQHFEYGAKAGVNLATMTDAKSPKTRTGLYAGVFTEYVINDYIGVQGELLYSMQGGKGEIPLVDGVGTSKLDYINLPILAKIYVLENLSVEVGPQFGYMVSAKSKVEVGGKSMTNSVYDMKGLKKFDVSAGMGLSYKLPFNLDVTARYNLGLTKVIGDSKNGVLQFGVGCRF